MRPGAARDTLIPRNHRDTMMHVGASGRDAKEPGEHPSLYAPAYISSSESELYSYRISFKHPPNPFLLFLHFLSICFHFSWAYLSALITVNEISQRVAVVKGGLAIATKVSLRHAGTKATNQAFGGGCAQATPTRA